MGARVLTLSLLCLTTLAAQAVTVGRTGDALTVRASGLTFIKGEPLARLKDGRSIRADLAVAVLPRSGAAGLVEVRQTFVLSYDLWEERFAVTTTGTPPKLATYLTSSAAEAWCLEQMTIPLHALDGLGRDQPFWIRLQYRIQDDRASADVREGYSLQSLIDALSRRRNANEWAHVLEAGPLRLGP